MNKLKILTVLYASMVLIGCSKDDEMAGSPDGSPYNLVIKATPSTDGSGKVVFTATANNANNFDFEFGDGASANAPTGEVTHTYTKAGNNTFPVTVKASNAAGKSLTKVTQVSVNVVITGSGLVWSDEFDVSGAPDVAKWSYDIGTGNGGWGNSELQYYTNRPENVVVQNGTLRIKAIKENYNGSAYTSARLITKEKFEFQYGRVEVRAKLPAGVGTWPAVWMLGADINSIGWPECGEIDIMEHRGSELNKISAALHYPGRFGGNPVVNTTTISDATTAFHVYKLEWTAASIKISVDDNLYFNVANSQSIPFNKKFFCLLNVAMGGTFGGAVDPAFTNATMEVDYIRVYNN